MTNQPLQQAIQYREQKNYPAAHQILEKLYAENPTDPVINYQLAWLHDVQGLERQAVPFYETAIENGLSVDDLKGALLGLGSTYRCLGDYDQAVTMLRKGIAAFPDAGEFPVFLAMALHNLGQHAEAMALLLKVAAETSEDVGIKSYQKAILFYHDKLDQVWE